MAISFVGSVSGAAADAGAITLDLTTIAGLAQNDLVIVAYSICVAADVDVAMTTSGYTEVADLYSDDTLDSNLGVFRKFMGASPDATAVTTSPGGTQAACAAVAMAFRGVDTSTPLDVASTTATGVNTFHPDPPSIDWSTAGTWVVIAGGNGHTLTSGWTYTFPTGYTTNAVNTGIDDNTVGNSTTAGMGYKSAPADPENPGVMTQAGSDSASFSWAAVTMALRSAAGTGQPHINIALIGV